MSNQPHLPNYVEGMPLLGGRYQITGRLGAGGFGQTFLARDRHRPGYPECVVKQLKPQVSNAEELRTARRLFETEAEVLSQLGDHPQIPRLLAHFEENQEFYLVQDLIRGHSLESELGLATPPTVRWSEAEAVNFLGDLLGTLEFVHEQRVIHRDIKPSNLVRRDRDNRLVLIDFGSVKQVTTQIAQAQSSLGRTISIGTQGYMPSEQVTGRPHFSSDIYAVGMIAIQGLTQRHPSTLSIDPETGEISWWEIVPYIHPALKTFLDTMVRYDFRARFLTASVALSALNCLPSELSQFIVLPAEEYARPESNDSSSYRSSGLTQPLPSPTAARTVAVLPQDDGLQASELQTNPLPTRRPAAASKPSSRNLLLPFGIGLGAVALLSVGLLARHNTAAEQQTAEQNVSEQDAAEQRAAEPDRTAQTNVSEGVEQPLEQQTVEESLAPTPEPILPTPTPELTPEPVVGTAPNPEDAIALVETFYSDISNKSWDSAIAAFSKELASVFSREFFEKFDRVTVENFALSSRTEETITLIGQNTYIYPNGDTQREERTFTLETIDGQPRLVDSQFVRVIKGRND